MNLIIILSSIDLFINLNVSRSKGIVINEKIIPGFYMKKYEGEVWSGKPFPLGAHYDGKGINFAIYSKTAGNVLLCLFKRPEDHSEYAQVQFHDCTNGVWHAYLPGLKPGLVYGYRFDGPFHPEQGYRFNPHKLLIDPYARAICGRTAVTEEMLDYVPGDKKSEYSGIISTVDSAPFTNKCSVVDDNYDWEGIMPPCIPIHKSIIYEAHVKGMTALHPDIPENERGTYKALGSPVMIDYFKNLGINAIELLPVHHFVHNKFLLDHGLSNYWGYNTIGYFAPHTEYCSAGMHGEQVREFKDMVKAFHKAGIEVILDVVYNHTGEGDHLGPTISFRGIDNEEYYRLDRKNRNFYTDYTGTGNSINAQSPVVTQLILDSLRYWAGEMQVDGFRFDLASTLIRGKSEIAKAAPFLHAVYQDPLLSSLKLIAEPWDLGRGGYLVGKFPAPWSEWNGKYRDCVRKYWRGDEGQLKELAHRLCGSEDFYAAQKRHPSASINFITCHDGFTLQDLVSYNYKYNQANGENNKDGESHNYSWNGGEEGAVDDPDIIALRQKRKRNFMATLLLSQGVPMISHGDEYGRTQKGNNNSYCQDNELSWFHWDWDREEKEFFQFVKGVIDIRKTHPVFRQANFLKGGEVKGEEIPDISWYNTAGEIMTSEEWDTNFIRCLGVLLNGGKMHGWDCKGREINDDIFLLLFNSYWEKVSFKLPLKSVYNEWEIVVDTHTGNSVKKGKKTREEYELNPRSFALLRVC